MGRWGEDAKGTAPQTVAQMLNKELTGPSSVQSYHVSCEPGIDRWMPAKLLNRFTTKLMSRLTAKLVDPLTAYKLVVVNFVKLHLTKLNARTAPSGKDRLKSYTEKVLFQSTSINPFLNPLSFQLKQ